MGINLEEVRKPIYQIIYSDFGARCLKLMGALISLSDDLLQKNKVRQTVWLENKDRYATIEFSGRTSFTEYMSIMMFANSIGYFILGIDIATEKEEYPSIDFVSIKNKSKEIEIKHSAFDRCDTLGRLSFKKLDIYPYIVTMPIISTCYRKSELQRILMTSINFDRIIECQLKGAGLGINRLKLMSCELGFCLVYNHTVHVFGNKFEIKRLADSVILSLKKFGYTGCKVGGIVNL